MEEFALKLQVVDLAREEGAYQEDEATKIKEILFEMKVSCWLEFYYSCV